MINVATNLLGETVEIRSAPSYPDYGTCFIARGVVRSVYTGDKGVLCVLIECLTDGAGEPPFGELRAYAVHHNPVRVVRKCGYCGLWDHPSRLVRDTPDPDWYEHADCARNRKAGNTP